MDEAAIEITFLAAVGRLSIESVPKNGAVFTACFPQPKAPTST